MITLHFFMLNSDYISVIIVYQESIKLPRYSLISLSKPTCDINIIFLCPNYPSCYLYKIVRMKNRILMD